MAGKIGVKRAKWVAMAREEYLAGFWYSEER